MHRWTNDELTKLQTAYPAWTALAEAIKTIRDDVKIDYENRIEAIINEYDAMPDQCLKIIAEEIQLARHYRMYPGAD